MYIIKQIDKQIFISRLSLTDYDMHIWKQLDFLAICNSFNLSTVPISLLLSIFVPVKP